MRALPCPFWSPCCSKSLFSPSPRARYPILWAKRESCFTKKTTRGSPRWPSCFRPKTTCGRVSSSPEREGYSDSSPKGFHRSSSVSSRRFAREDRVHRSTLRPGDPGGLGDPRPPARRAALPPPRHHGPHPDREGLHHLEERASPGPGEGARNPAHPIPRGGGARPRGVQPFLRGNLQGTAHAGAGARVASPPGAGGARARRVLEEGARVLRPAGLFHLPLLSDVLRPPGGAGKERPHSHGARRASFEARHLPRDVPAPELVSLQHRGRGAPGARAVPRPQEDARDRGG